MANVFKATAEYVRSTRMIVLAFFVFLAGTIISAGLLAEDLGTTYYAYIELPTRKIYWITPFLVAALPTVGTMAASYAYGMNVGTGGRMKIFLIVAILFVVFDTITDYTYKIGGTAQLGTFDYVWGFIETLWLYTVGAELMFTFCLGTLLEIWSDSLQKLGDIVAETIEVIVAVIERLSQTMAHLTDSLFGNGGDDGRGGGDTPKRGGSNNRADWQQ